MSCYEILRGFYSFKWYEWGHYRGSLSLSICMYVCIYIYIYICVCVCMCIICGVSYSRHANRRAKGSISGFYD